MEIYLLVKNEYISKILSNQEFKQTWVLVQVLIVDVVLDHSLRQTSEIVGVLQLDTDQYWTLVAVGLLVVFEVGDIIVWTQHIGHKVLQCARALREAYHEVVLQSLIEQRTFLDILHSHDVVVASAYDTYHILALDLLGIVVECADAQCASRLNDDSIEVIEVKDC